MNYVEGTCENEITPQVTPQVKVEETILAFCNVPRSRKEIAALLDVKSTRVKKLLSELIAESAVVAEGSNRNRTYKLKS